MAFVVLVWWQAKRLHQVVNDLGFSSYEAFLKLSSFGQQPRREEFIAVCRM